MGLYLEALYGGWPQCTRHERRYPAQPNDAHLPSCPADMSVKEVPQPGEQQHAECEGEVLRVREVDARLDEVQRPPSNPSI